MLRRQMVIITKDTSNNETVEINIPFNISTEATYQQIDTAARKIARLTTNNYYDTHVINTVSLAEELGG